MESKNEQRAVTPIQQLTRGLTDLEKYDIEKDFVDQDGRTFVDFHKLIGMIAIVANEIFEKYYVIETKPGVFVYYSKTELPKKKSEENTDGS